MGKKAEYGELLKEHRERKAYRAELGKRTKLLLHKEKRLFRTLKRLKKPEEPILFLLRMWGDVEIYEGVKQSTFIIPPVGADGPISIGQRTAKERGQRTVYLSPSDLKTIAYGTDTVRAYFVDENDAMPLGGNPKVFSERMEYTIDAILLNYEKYLRKKSEGNAVQWGKMVLYIAVGLGILWVLWTLFQPATGGAPTPGTIEIPFEAIRQNMTFIT